MKRNPQVSKQTAELLVGCRAAGDQHIIGIGAGAGGGDFAQGRPQSSANFIANDRVADLLRDREPEPWTAWARDTQGRLRPNDAISAPQFALKHERSTRRTSATANSLKVRPNLERRDRSCCQHHGNAKFSAGFAIRCANHRVINQTGSSQRDHANPVTPKRSRRQALATLRTTPGQDPHATGRLHALAKAMPTFAHEAAGLIRTFHVRLRALTATRRTCAR